MDTLELAVAAVLAILLAVAVAMILARGRELEAIRGVAADSGASAADPGAAIRTLRRQLAAAEAELDQQRRTAAFMADLVGVGILRLDDGRRIDLANAAAHLLLDRPAGSLVGRTILESFVDARAEELIASAIEGGSAAGEVRLRGTEGPIVVVRARRSPVGGVWVVLDDVTELRNLQQIRAEFIDNLSHELRTPLTTVSLLSETLAREADAAGDAIPPRMRERMAKIEVETGHLVQMVTELLDLARIESGRSLLLLERLDAGRVVVETVERLRLFAERQGVRLRTEIADDLPAIRGDEARIGQVLVNLLHNAVKFSDADDEVVVRAERRGAEVVIAVRDEGIGIPKADQARIFERFYKVDRARVRGGGTGLGLSIARNVVEQHGGRIWVESEESVGSTFSLALPVAGEPAAGTAETSH